MVNESRHLTSGKSSRSNKSLRQNETLSSIVAPTKIGHYDAILILIKYLRFNQSRAIVYINGVKCAFTDIMAASISPLRGVRAQAFMRAQMIP